MQMSPEELRTLHERVMQSRQVLDAISAVSPSNPSSSNQSAARRMVERIVGVQRAIVMYITVFVIRLFFPLIFPMGMHMDDESLTNLRSAVSADPRRPVILLPTHKSHVDYIALDLVMQEKKLPIPLIVSGDNLNMPLLGWVMHACGAMFIRRSFAGDRIYSAVFNETMIELLSNNRILACFIEGGRSRSGKLLTPKAGFLKSVVDAVVDGRVEDALIVPISFSYGRVVEANSMMHEMSGGTKKKEAFSDTVRSIMRLIRTTFFGSACYGSVEISVAPGFSVRDHLKARGGDPASSPIVSSSPPAAAPTTSEELSQPGFDLDAVQQPGTTVYRLKSTDRKLSIVLDPENLTDKKTRVQLALSLGFRTLHECNRVGVIQGTSLVGTVLLMHKDRGLKLSDLVDKVEWLRREIVSRGGKVQEMNSVQDTVSEVIDKIMWGSGRARLIKKHKSVVMTSLFTPMETLELSTFRNNLIHLFVQDGVVAISLYAALMRVNHRHKDESAGSAVTTPTSVTSLARDQSPRDISIALLSKTARLMDVQHGAQFLSVLLKHEFIYKPVVPGTTGISSSTSSAFTDNFLSITKYMQERNIIKVDGQTEEDEKSSSPLVQVGSAKGFYLWEFLCGLLFPFIDSYFLTLLGCYIKLSESVEVELAHLVSQIQDLGENLFMSNLLDHYDAIAKDTVNNALAAFADIGILLIESKEGSKSVKIVKFKIPKKNVLETIELLHSFRKSKTGDSPHQIIDAIEVGKSMSESSFDDGDKKTE